MRTEQNGSVEQLGIRLKENLAEFINCWSKMSSHELIQNSYEITAIQLAAQHLPAVLDLNDAEFLLRYKNPLKVVSDRWLAMTDGIIEEDLNDILEGLQMTQLSHETYELATDETIAPPTTQMLM